MHFKLTADRPGGDMNQGLLIIDVSDARTRSPIKGALVGLSTFTAEGQLIQIFNNAGSPWINPNVNTGSDGIALFSFGWDETQIGDATSGVKFRANISSAPPYRTFQHSSGELELVVDLSNVYSGRLPTFKKGTSLLTATLKAYLKYIGSKIPLPQSLGLKAGKLSPQLYGLIGVLQVKI
jgi:hypothetical protein